MRRQAKPFTVEIRKSRKSAGSAEPLLGMLDLRPEPGESPAASAAAIAAQKLFGRPLEGESRPDAARPAEARRPVILASLEVRPRVLPDLTAEEKPAVLAEAPVRRRAAAETEAAEAPQPKRRARRKPAPQAVEAVEAEERPIILPVAPEAAASDDVSQKRAKRRPRIALRRRGDALLPVFRAGERWKRRLPPALW